jgi:hypothetical protein
MRQTKTVDLSTHVNADSIRGDADFDVLRRPCAYLDGEGNSHFVAGQSVIVRTDNGVPLSVVSDKYVLVQHRALLDSLDEAIAGLDCGPVPRGIFVASDGAKMRAVYKFPGIAENLDDGKDEFCPAVAVQNSYDRTSRIGVQIGAYRFACTNLALGGGGVFAGGFLTAHKGHVPVAEVSLRLKEFLERFSDIMGQLRMWNQTALDAAPIREWLDTLPESHALRLEARGIMSASTVYDSHNVATDYATHGMKSATAGFKLMDDINATYQTAFPLT